MSKTLEIYEDFIGLVAAYVKDFIKAKTEHRHLPELRPIVRQLRRRLRRNDDYIEFARAGLKRNEAATAARDAANGVPPIIPRAGELPRQVLARAAAQERAIAQAKGEETDGIPQIISQQQLARQLAMGLITERADQMGVIIASE